MARLGGHLSFCGMPGGGRTLQEHIGLPSMASMGVPCLELSWCSNVERLSPSFGFWIVRRRCRQRRRRSTAAVFASPGPSFLPSLPPTLHRLTLLDSFGSGPTPARSIDLPFFLDHGRRRIQRDLHRAAGRFTSFRGGSFPS